MTRRRCDLVIIGGGIHGAGVAQAAAAAGYRALLLEKEQPAAGTSSRSSKLIHGGLRYLESLQFSLVRESLRERELLLKNARGLVKLVPFFIPIYNHTNRRPWQIRIGLSLYALLGGVRRHARFRSVPKRHWQQFEGLNTEGLQRVFQYFDAQTDDAALTRAVLQSANSLGAESLWPAEFLSAQQSDTGYHVRFRHRDADHDCDTTVLVNAAGPWINVVREKITPLPPRIEIDLIQGAHIVFDEPICADIFYLEPPQDHRAVFIMPWQGRTLVGTTETVFRGELDNVQPLGEEIAYLEGVVRYYFPACRAAIVNSFAGLRVLPRGKGSAFGRTRETSLVGDTRRCPHYLAIYGGKLTGYRATAEKVLGMIRPSLPSRKPIASTRELRLS